MTFKPSISIEAMRYDIKLTIDYIYESPAAGARQILHVMPLAIEGRQRVIAGSIQIEPKPAMRQDRRDFFGNELTELAFTEPHSDITIVLKARVEVTGSAAPGLSSPDLAGLASALQAENRSRTPLALALSCSLSLCRARQGHCRLGANPSAAGPRGG